MARRYGFVVSGRTRYCTSATADVLVAEKSIVLPALGPVRAADLLSGTWHGDSSVSSALRSWPSYVVQA
jgi:hypothetical protein